MPNEGSVCQKCNTSMQPIELIAHRYVFHPKNRLGKGVIKVWDQRMGRWTAIKFPEGKKQYRSIEDSSESRVSRIEREMLIQAQLEHPAIVSAYDVVEDPDYGKGLVMSLVEGLSLHKLVSKHGPLRLRASVEIIRDITNAVQYMHKKSIVHRDLTPGNIIIEGKKPVLIDFGLAKRLADSSNTEGYLKARNITGRDLMVTEEGEILGTPLFMAPEQVEGTAKRIDQRSDIYGLGATLYYISTGSPPFSGKDVLSVISQVLHRDPLPPSQVNRLVDKPLEAIIQKAMQKDREKRFQNAEEFQEALQNWLDGEDLSPEIYKTPFSQKFFRRLGKMRKMLLVGLLLLGLLFTLGSYLYLGYIQSQYGSGLPKNKEKLARLLEGMGGRWGFEIIEEARKEENYVVALRVLEWLKKQQEKAKNPEGPSPKKIKEMEEEILAQKNRQEKFQKAQDFLEKAESLKLANPPVALFFYLNSFDNFKELYEEKAEPRVKKALEEIPQKGTLFEEKDIKMAFKFYWGILKSLESTFGKSQDQDMRRKILALRIKTKELQEKMK